MNNTTTISFLPLTSLVMDEREIRSLRILLDLLIDGAKKDEAK